MTKCLFRGYSFRDLCILFLVLASLFLLSSCSSKVKSKEPSKPEHQTNKQIFAKKEIEIVNTESGHDSMLDTLEKTQDLKEQEQIIRKLYDEKRQDKALFLNFLSQKKYRYAKNKDRAVFETVLFIIGLTEDHDYVEPLMELLFDQKYMDCMCIYYCGVVFALTHLATEADMKRINKREAEIDDDQKISNEYISAAVNEINSARRRLRNKQSSTKTEQWMGFPAVQYASPDDQRRYEEIISLSTDEMVSIAMDRRKDYKERQMAMYALSGMAESEELIPDILVLITTNPEYHDGIDEFRGAGIIALENILIENHKSIPIN